MGKLRNHEKGFSAIEGLLVLLVVALMGGVGYFVYKSSHKSNTDSAASASKSTAEVAKQTSPASPVFNKLPDGWTEYKSDMAGLRLGYPKAWGTLDPTTLHTPNYQDDTKNMQGQLVVDASKKDGFTVVARKYGATIKPSSDGKSWIVAEENPANVDGYKVGGTYRAKEVKVSGGTAIDLTFVDEECTQTRWLFSLKDSYIVVTIPELCPANLEPISATIKAAYTKLVSDFLATVTIY